ncbi:siderophore-interacting protein [Microbacterium sp. 2C]|uniref:siderophore-interacting protein n=1 Tax=Micrococcales TaxID=85006 RepID=UPI0018C2C884|nr:siderophore-interacting protein [Microbacterium paulum]MBG0717225.1 siderophore-interacting protein [Microbacterium paulum]
MARSIRPSLIEPITLRELTVVDTFDISASMRRIVIGGPQLDGFRTDDHELPPLVTSGFDDEIKVFFPDPLTGELHLPIQRDRVIEWPRDPRPVARTYTVRAFDADRQRLELDFVLHGTGVASTWARTCEAGDRIHIAGPKMSLLHPADTDWLLIAGDDTAIPAIARWLEEVPDDLPAEVFIEVGGTADEQAIETGAHVTVTWVHRGPVPAGTTTHLADAVQAVRWRDGRPFAWVAGETLAIKPIRRWLREEKALAPERVEVTGYWRRTTVEEIEGTGGLPDPDSEVDDIDRMHELIDPLPSRAIRVAVTLGIIPAIRRGHDTAAQIAAEVGADATGVHKLLRYLATIDVVEALDDGRYAVTTFGAVLDDDEVTEELNLRHPIGGLVRVFDGLLDAVQTGFPAAQQTLGGSINALADASDEVAVAVEDAAAAELEWLRPAFSREYVFRPGERVVAGGAGAATLLSDALGADAAPAVTLVVRPSREQAALATLSDATRAHVCAHLGSVLDPWPRAETVVLGSTLADLNDNDAVQALRNAYDAVEDGGRMLVVEHLLVPDEIDDHDAAADLQSFCLHGSGFRTADEVRTLITRAGLDISRENTIGWGEPVFEIVR